MIILFLLFSGCKNWGNRVKEFYMPIEFNGIVVEKIIDKESRMQPYLMLNNHIKYRVANPIYWSIQLGDTLFKVRGSMKYYWIKNGDTIVFYQQNGNIDLTDSI